MEWITPVTNRLPNSYTTAEDMNRITNNVAYLGGSPVKLTYTDKDIVTAAEWAYIIDFVQGKAREITVTDATTYTNLNAIEQALIEAYDDSQLTPGNSLYPGNALYPNTEGQ